MKGYQRPFLLSLLSVGLLLTACVQADSQDGKVATKWQESSPIAPAPRAVVAITAEPSNECKKIIFSMVDIKIGDYPDIYSVCADGSGLTQLTNDPAAESSPAWSPDGTRISFASRRSGEDHIYIMDADTDNLLQLTHDYQNGRPVWLPDGKQIAFLTTDMQGLWWWRIVDLETSEITQFTEPSYDFFYQTPAWSPNGEQIAYMSMEEQALRNDGSSQIHVKNIDGSNDVALINDIWANINPIWSPDGEKIAFLSERDGTYNMYALYIMDKDGQNVQRLTEPNYSNRAVYTWSPDGQQIAIDNRTMGYIFIIDINTANQRELLILDDGQTAFGPSWQP